MEFRQFTVDGKLYPNQYFDFGPNLKRFFELKSSESQKVKEFFKFISLCHKMVVEHDGEIP